MKLYFWALLWVVEGGMVEGGMVEGRMVEGGLREGGIREGGLGTALGQGGLVLLQEGGGGAEQTLPRNVFCK